MAHDSPTEHHNDLEDRVAALETAMATLKTDVMTAMQALYELLDSDGPLAIKLAALETTLGDLNAELRASDDAMGDGRTIRAMEATLNEIKTKIGVRS